MKKTMKCKQKKVLKRTFSSSNIKSIHSLKAYIHRRSKNTEKIYKETQLLPVSYEMLTVYSGLTTGGVLVRVTTAVVDTTTRA